MPGLRSTRQKIIVRLRDGLNDKKKLPRHFHCHLHGGRVTVIQAFTDLTCTYAMQIIAVFCTKKEDDARTVLPLKNIRANDKGHKVAVYATVEGNYVKGVIRNVQRGMGNADLARLIIHQGNPSWQSAIGYCSQTDGLLDSLTAREYLRLIARLRGVPEGDIPSLVDYLLYTFRLSGHARRKCGTYSGGNRRKLSVAAALIGQPRVVFLDEPSAGVDVLARRDILAALRAISGTCGTAVVMTSHK
ncbi:hypothetical protein MRX96_056239 [Rhipicephalus microplus]